MPTEEVRDQRKPLPYHFAIRDYLKNEESQIWEWYASNRVRSEQAEAIRFELLKSTYRIDREAQPAIYDVADQVVKHLELPVPITLYQAQNPQGLNASLAYIPEEAHVVFHGPVSSKLSEPELRALLAHELGHLLLYRQWNGDLLIADQVLSAMTHDREADTSHFASARLFGLYTEVFCDRNCLKNYLRYAEAVSVGDAESAAGITHTLSRWSHSETEVATPSREFVVEQLAQALNTAGYQVDFSVGQSHFRCDLAIYQDGDEIYRLGILVDGESYYEQSDILERDVMRPKLLRTFGWRIVFVLAKEWFSDQERVMARLIATLEGNETTEDEDAARYDEEVPFGHDVPDEATHSQPDAEDDILRNEAEDEAIEVSETRRFEFRDGKSSKFWEIAIAGNRHSVTFGRIGTRGQTRWKSFDDEVTAKNDYERLIREKIKKGYEELD